MRVSLSVFVLFAVSLVALPVAAQHSFSRDIYFNHLSGLEGEGVDVRLPRIRVPPGLDGEYVVDFLPKVKLIVGDDEGNTIATINNLVYRPSGLTITFTAVNIGDGYAELLVNGEWTGGQLPVSINGRVEYDAELLILITPTLVRDDQSTNNDGASPGEYVGFDVDVTGYNLATGVTVARFKAGKALKDSVN